MVRIYPKLVCAAIILAISILWQPTGLGAVHAADDFSLARKNMVQYQIRDRGVKDQNTLTAMAGVLRHIFVPADLQKKAYEDRPLPIGHGQTISQPYIVAVMTELLKLDSQSRVLEVGTGSGYQAAVLARIAKEVYSVEIVRPLHERSKKVLEQQGYKNVRTIHKDGYFGWEAHAPYDAIIVTCASDFIPPPLIAQLKIGGRMCIPVGPPFKVQHLVLVEKKEDNRIVTRIIASVRFVPLVRTAD